MLFFFVVGGNGMMLTSFAHKQLTPPLPQKMCSFVENVPGTAISIFT